MQLLFKNKINKIRTFALSLVFIGIAVMYIGLLFKGSQIAMAAFMLLGVIFVLMSTGVYFWVGMLSTKAIQVTCPECGKWTKMLGRVDACMHCSQPLTMDKALEGKDFDVSYNRRSHASNEESEIDHKK
ncbi:YgzB family protein [Aureibacillus halotolerans]|uniref:Zinc ribbon protein n=1 Tax=Aureibacillus halotolerans TaxID=1508390 RepID=A0A4V3D4A0_9BACI|nr:YgzB family protein [Aureibacillus halotolerans]TDQ33735.1 zinc ribbon protein [Aureibacillus halotolerans]